MPDIFISYSSENEGMAEQIRQVLEQNGISCWYAPKALRGTQDFTAEIPQAIRSAKGFLLLMSKEAQKSKWVQRELGEADECDLPVYTFFLEDCPLNDQFRFVLRFNQHYEAALGYEEQMRRLIRELQEDLAKDPTEPVVPPPNKPAKKGKLGVLLGAAVAVVVLLVAGFLLLGGSRDGKYVIWNPAFGVALSGETVNSYYLAGCEVQSKGDTLTGYPGKCVWTVKFTGRDTVTILRDGVALGAKPGYNGIGLGGDYTATVWVLEEAEDGYVYLRNAETHYYLEWYAAKTNWNIHNKLTEDNREQFLLRMDKAK